jgi:phosphatidylglycerophosphate synthase
MTAPREMQFLLAGPERRVLHWLAARVPRRIRSNHLTALGMIGATGAGGAYALSTYDYKWLWVASAMLLVNWLGDSLDGTLARVRGTQRPKYGYYLDHVVDAFSTTMIGLGLGLSPYVYLGIALGIVIVYLAMSINVYLESTVFGVFKISYGRIGPTEVRLILILLNTAALITHGWPSPLPVPINVLANWTLGILLVGMVLLFVGRFARNLHRLAKLEPQRFRWWEQSQPPEPPRPPQTPTN